MFCSFGFVCIGGSVVGTREGVVSGGPSLFLFLLQKEGSGSETAMEKSQCERDQIGWMGANEESDE